MNRQNNDIVKVLDGSSFYVSDGIGDVYRENTDGLFFKDTRFLSRQILKVNDKKPSLLSCKNIDYFSARFFMTMPFKTAFDEHPLSIVRSRLVGRGSAEQIFLENNGPTPKELVLTVEFDCDFADLFEVKGGAISTHRNIDLKIDGSDLSFSYDNKEVNFKTLIHMSQQCTVVDKIAYFRVSLDPKESWSLEITTSPVIGERIEKPKYTLSSFGDARPEMEKSMNGWLDQMPQLKSDMDFLDHAYNRTTIDLAALRFYPNGSDRPVLAAGLPWFMALFGRDNLITSYQTCYLVPELAQDALTALSQLQGTKVDHFTDEEPGKILHEQRFDEFTKLGELPYQPYYGSADSTPLFLILLHEYYRWTADDKFVKQLETHARAALNWIDEYGDADSDGFVEYKTKSPKGLPNQCWKDSPTSIQFANGTIAEAPLAVVEIQGYVFDAKMRTAELADKVWGDHLLADRLRKQAQELKQSFNKTFWIDSHGGYFAIALDKHKRKVDSISSNMGQLLWTGIVDKEKADQVVKQLLSSNLFTGWGVRTLSSSAAGFNPIGYHTGTVWPHDNSLIAAGLARYGYKKEAIKITEALVEAAHYFSYRLPEVFAGYPRSEFDFPVEFPTACSPQAWAAGTPALLLRIMLGLDVNPTDRTASIHPSLPRSVSNLRLQNLKLFDETYEIEITPDKQEIRKCRAKPSAKEHLRESKRWIGTQ